MAQGQDRAGAAAELGSPRKAALCAGLFSQEKHEISIEGDFKCYTSKCAARL